MNRKASIITALAVLIVLVACNTEPPKTAAGQSSEKQTGTPQDSQSCANPTRYPNNDKPMALMMRQMADNAALMKQKIGKGEAVTGSEFPFIRFHLVEPTDPDVLQPQFFENARLFQLAHKELTGAAQGQQKALYNAYIARCISCHESYCSGPLKRIRKLVID